MDHEKKDMIKEQISDLFCVFVWQKTAADGKRQEIIVLDSKRSNAINIGLTVLPPPRTIKTAILNFDEYALNKEGIEVRDTDERNLIHLSTIHVLKPSA